MKIAFVSTILKYPWGSPDRMWTDMANQCLDQGDQILLAISPATADCDHVRRLTDRGANLFLRKEHTVFQGRRRELANRLPWKRASILQGCLEKFAPDVVVITLGANFDMLAEEGLCRWLARRDVPYAAICHNSNLHFELTYGQKRLAHQFFARSSLNGFPSTQNQRSAEYQLGSQLPRVNIFQYPLGCLYPTAYPWSDTSGPMRMGVVARLDIRHKGLDLLISALAGVSQQMDYSVDLVGRNEDPATLDAVIKEQELSDRVRICPPVGPEDLPMVYGRLELFLLPSRYEGCPCSMSEAMMCGRPVLACPVGGVSDWIEDGRNGFVVADQSPESIREGILRAFEQRDQLRSMGLESRRIFDERRHPDPVANLRQEIMKSVQTRAFS